MTGHFRGLVGFETRPGATGGHSGAVFPQMTACAPPNGNCAPPNEDCSPKKLTGSKLLECKSRPKLVFFVDWHRISWCFWDEDRFVFFEAPVFSRKKTLEFPISAGKFLWIFAPHLVHLIQTGINFSCPRAPLEFTQNKLLVPPQIYFCPPPQSRYPAAGPVRDQGLDLRDQDQGLQNVSSRTSSRPGASPAGGQGGQCTPDFRFCPPPPNFFLAPHGIFLEEVWCFWAEKTLKFAISARKSLRILAKTLFFLDHLLFGRKICDFGENLCPLILILPPRSREAGDAPARGKGRPQGLHLCLLLATIML